MDDDTANINPLCEYAASNIVPSNMAHRCLHLPAKPRWDFCRQSLAQCQTLAIPGVRTGSSYWSLIPGMQGNKYDE